MPREVYIPQIHVKVLPIAPPASEAQLKGFFRRFDLNGDGVLSRDELKKAFKEIGSFIPGWRADRAILFADQNGDGLVNIEQELDILVQYAVKYGYKFK